jgi:hypothetical protein
MIHFPLMTRPSRPPPRKSGRAPRMAAPAPDAQDASLPTFSRLSRAMQVQNARKVPDTGTKSRHLTRIATDLELAFIRRQPREVTDQLCLDIAATALRILEQGDGRS